MEKQWVVYILECRDGSLYTGITDNLDKRLKAHNSGRGAKYTRGRGPVELRYRESCADHGTALRREIEIKRLTRQQKWLLIGEYRPNAEDILQNSGGRCIIDQIPCANPLRGFMEGRK